MAGPAERHEVLGTVVSAAGYRLDVVYFIEQDHPAFGEALLTVGMRLCVPVTDTLPAPPVLPVDIRGSFVAVVFLTLFLTMDFTILSI